MKREQLIPLHVERHGRDGGCKSGLFRIAKFKERSECLACEVWVGLGWYCAAISECDGDGDGDGDVQY